MLEINYRVGVLVVLLAVIGGGVIAAPAAGAENESQQNQGQVIVSTLQEEAGSEQTVVVRLEEGDRSSSMRATDTETTIGTMQSQAERSQEPIIAFADGNPHVTVIDRHWLTAAVVIEVDTGHVPLDRLSQIDNVERVHPNYKIGIPEGETEPTEEISDSASDESGTISTTASSGVDYTRAIERIKADTVIERGNRGGGVKVAVIDSGVEPTHPDIDISDDRWGCFINCSGNPNGPHDNYGHGTHVSAAVTGGDANTQDLHLGVAPNATLYHAKAFNDTGSGTFSSTVNSMEWAVQQDADVISISAGTEGQQSVYIDAVRNAEASGSIVVAAIGNNGTGTSVSPGNTYDAISVGSTNLEPDYPQNGSFGIPDDEISPFSGGETIDKTDWGTNQTTDDPVAPDEWPDSYDVPTVVAPGNLIWSADEEPNTQTNCRGFPPNKQLTCLEGTSMATPYVSGTVALMEAANESDLGPDYTKQVLTDTAVDLGKRQTRQGAGVINATAAVNAVKPANQSNSTPDNGTNDTIPDGNNLSINITASPDRLYVDDLAFIRYKLTNPTNDTRDRDIVVSVNGEVRDVINSGTIPAQGEIVDTWVGFVEEGKMTVKLSVGNQSDTTNFTVVDPSVKITNISLTPDKINTNTTNHTLIFDLNNVSDDGQPDHINIELPKNIAITNVSNTSAVDVAGHTVPVKNTTIPADHILNITVSPNSSANFRTVSVETEFVARIKQ